MKGIHTMRSSIKIPYTRRHLAKRMRLPLLFCRAIGTCISFTRPCKLQLVATLLLAALYIYVAVISTANNSESFLKIVDDFGDLLKAGVMVFVQCEMYNNMEHLVRCFKKLGAAEVYLSDGCPGLERWIIKTVSFRASIQILLLIVFVNPICNNWSLMKIADFSLNSYIGLFLYSPWLLVGSLLYFANRQFDLIISRLIERGPYDFLQKGSSKYRSLLKNHALLCWAIDDLTLWFQRSFVAFSAFYFYRSTFSYYEILRYVLSLVARPRRCVALRFFTALMWQVLRTTGFWLVISSCQEAERNSMKFTSELHEIIKKSGVMTVEGMLKIHFIVKPKVVFWANGFFKIDNTLVHSMIGAGATYLAVVYQYIDSPKFNATSRITTTTPTFLYTEQSS